MIARVELHYSARDKFVEMAQDEAVYATLARMFPNAPTPENKHLAYYWTTDVLIDLETDGPWLTEAGITFEVKNFKGCLPLKTVISETGGAQHVTVQVQVPHIGLLMMQEVMVEENCCTDILQRRLDEGWRILCVCPPNAQRRPDYVLGRSKE